MLWLEMARDPTHGAGEWEFGKCLWSPTRNRGNHKWAFWETVNKARADDSVLHLRGVGDQARFVGFSTADTDGIETEERPPKPGQWGFAEKFYRAKLRDFTEFKTPISLNHVFAERNAGIRNYFHQNRSKHPNQKRHIFLVVQNGNLQCLNGAYLSEADDELGSLLLGHDFDGDSGTRVHHQGIHTGEQIGQLKTRVGQKAFADAIKSNYGYQCCFPGCEVADERFLVGAHIARWADVPELRGRIDNGLCLCLMHDRAFERGLFVVSQNHSISINNSIPLVSNNEWFTKHVANYENESIRQGEVVPSYESITLHWTRVGFTTNNQ